MISERKENSRILLISIVLLFIGTSILPMTLSIGSAQLTRNEPPTVSIVKPVEKSFYIRDFRLLPSLRTHILGFITVKVNAADDVEVKQVEIYIDGELKNISTTVHSCGSYMWIWNERSWLQSRHTLKVIAVDTDGLTAEDTREVVLHNFPILHPLYP
ncbi:MAG TPA: Ig-like domain-containing protein [Candidatus Thermoplasmatota archaeon]|nr:Ig-like domain-containing protein [Candidatus Thermoplasmatota archaeon]